MPTNNKLIECVARRMLADMKDHGGIDDFCEKLLGYPEQYLSELAAGAVDELSGNPGALALATARNDALDEAKRVAIRRRKEAMKSPHPDSIIREDEAEEIVVAIEALKGSKS